MCVTDMLRMYVSIINRSFSELTTYTWSWQHASCSWRSVNSSLLSNHHLSNDLTSWTLTHLFILFFETTLTLSQMCKTFFRMLNWTFCGGGMCNHQQCNAENDGHAGLYKTASEVTIVTTRTTSRLTNHSELCRPCCWFQEKTAE